jgi:NDP-sugar pyrophosphorylase family protein
MHADVARDVMRRVMEQRALLHIPLVDEHNKLVGLETYQGMVAGTRHENWVCLMAGGFGTRLGGLTKDRPKPMLPVNGKPILESIIENFVTAGFSRFYISLHYLGNQIREHFGDGSRWNVTIRYVEEQTPLGTCGAIGLLPDIGVLPLIVMNGDLLTRLDVNALLDSHVRNDVGMTLCVTEYDMQVPYGVVTGKDSLVTEIVEKPVHKFFVNAGIYVISPDVVERARPPRRLDIPDLVKGLIDSNRKVSMFPIHEYWLDIGRPDDFERAQENKPR